MLSPVTSFQAQPCRLLPPALVCSIGDDLAAITDALFNGRRGLVYDDVFTPGRSLPLGRVTTALPDARDLPPEHRSRNNQLLAAALERLAPTLDAFRKRSPQARIGVVLGTSTSGIGETEMAVGERMKEGKWPSDFHYQRHEIGSPAKFIAERLGLEGPAYTLSTACTSSARSLASAKRLLTSGICDAVIAGGADSLCGLTVNGFASLEALSDHPSQPSQPTVMASTSEKQQRCFWSPPKPAVFSSVVTARAVTPTIFQRHGPTARALFAPFKPP